MARTARPETTEAERLLKVAKYYLQNRKFKKSSKYARKAQQYGLNHLGPHQILAISAVLSAATTTTTTTTDHYSILRLPSLTQEQTLIKSHFENLSALLNPIENPFPFASEAHDLVLEAWAVLSNPAEKTRFDKGLKMDRDRNSFWTMCPYCYYVYEYENAYLDCCLRCQNENCGKGFHAEPIRGPPPPPEVVVKGSYACNGFLPVGGGENGWVPLVPGLSSSGNGNEEGGDGLGKGVCIEISDDEKAKKVVGANVKKMEVKGGIKIKEKVVGANVERTEVKGGIKIMDKVVGATVVKMEVKGGIEIKEKVMGENVERMEVKGGIEIKDKVVGANVGSMEIEGDKYEGNNDGGFVVESVEKEGVGNNKGKTGMRRKKLVSRNSKKFMGKGVRIKRDEALPMEGIEGEEGNESDENVGGESSKAGTGMEFFDGDDDIFVGLQDIDK